MLLTHPKDGMRFILRTQPPLVIGQIVSGDIERLIKDNQPMAVGKPLERNDIAVFYCGLLAPYKWPEDAQAHADQLARIMRKMSDFYLHFVENK